MVRHLCMWSKLVCQIPVHALLKAAFLTCLGMQTTRRPSQNCHRKIRKASALQSSGFISVAFGVSITTAMAPTTMPEGAICCSTVHWSPCCTYCRNVCSSTGPGLCCTAPCVLHHSKNISIASHHRFTAGRLHGTEDRLQGA